MDTSDIAFYVVQNEEGKFFRRKGYGGGGETWVDSLKTARVWTNIAGARTVSSYFFNNYKGYPPLKIIKMTISATEIIDDTERLEKIRNRKLKEAEERELRESKRRLQEAERDLQKAQERYDRERRRKRT